MLENKNSVKNASKRGWNDLTDLEQIEILRKTMKKAYDRVTAVCENVEMYEKIFHEHLKDLRLYGSSELLNESYIRAYDFANGKGKDKSAVYIGVCACVKALYARRDFIIGKTDKNGMEREISNGLEITFSSVPESFDSIEKADFRLTIDNLLKSDSKKVIVDLRERGYTIAEIANATNASYSSVQRLLASLYKALKEN